MTKFIYDDETGAEKAASGSFTYEDAMPANMGPVEPKPNAFMAAKQGMGEGLMNFGSKMIAGPAGKIAGTLIGGSGVPGLPLQSHDVERAVSGALTYEPTSDLGKKTAYALDTPARLFGQFTNWAGRKTEEKTGSPMLGEMAQKSLEIAPYGVGRGPGRVPGGAAAEAMFDANQPAPRMVGPDPAVLERARSAGLKLTPSEAGGGMISRGLESFAGEPALSKGIARANEPVAERMIARDLPGAGGEISTDSIARVREQANAAYERARHSGYMVGDPQLRTQLENIGGQVRRLAMDFPENPIAQGQLAQLERVVVGLDAPVRSADSTVTMINQIREQASGLYSQGNSTMGGIYRNVADALEGHIERHLERSGQAPDILEGFRNARRTLAKAHEAESASSSGSLNPQYYARLYGQRRGQLTGGAGELGEAAREFPRSLRNPRGVGNPHGPTMMDAVSAAAMNSMAPGGLGLAADVASLGLRPAIRAGLSSAPGQAMIGAPLSPAAAGAMQFGVTPQEIADRLQRGEPR